MKKDANDVAREQGPNALKAELEQAAIGVEFRRMSDVPAQSVAWLWRDRIPLSKLTLIPGDPGLGKSFVTAGDWAARISTGTAWPDGSECERGNVIILNAEDDAGDTIRPRLEAHGTDLSRIFIIDAVKDEEKRRGFCLEKDIPRLADTAKQIGGARAAIIDPMGAYMGKTDSHNNSEVRGLLAPLAEMAARHEMAVIAVTHLNKSGSGKAIYRASGSLAFAAAARAVWSISKDPEDPDRRLFLPVKMNLAKYSGGLAYRIEGEPARVVWEEGTVDMNADEAMEHENHMNSQQGPSRCDVAGEWLKDLLKAGPKEVSDIQLEAKGAGHTWGTLKRAKDEIGVRAAKSLGFGGKWRWELTA